MQSSNTLNIKKLNTTFACIITTTNLSNDTNYNASEYASNYTNLEIAGDFIRKIRYN